MSINTGQIQGVIGKVTAGTSLINAVLVSLQSAYDVQSTDNVKFVFNYREEDKASLRSDITDHYTEVNSAKQDQVALRPKEVQVHGYVGELNNSNSQNSYIAQIQRIADLLPSLGPYVPQLTVQALQLYNQAQQIYNTAAAAAATVQQFFDLFSSNPSFQTKQQRAYAYFEKHWTDRDLFTVNTPWGVFKNMSILSLEATQEGETESVSDFQIRFKEMSFASTIASSDRVVSGRLQQMQQLLANQGLQNPLSVGPLVLTGDPLTQPGAFA